MKLEIESIDIKEIQAGSKTHAQEGVLYVNLKELEELILKDARIQICGYSSGLPGPKSESPESNGCYSTPMQGR